MSTHRSRQLEDIIQLSRKMLVHARDGEWEQVTGFEAKRREMVLRCFQQQTPEQDAPRVAAAIRAILQLNQEVADLGRAYRNQLGSEIQSQHVGRAASAAYLSCAR